jgi:hypothetical protein
LKGRGIMINNRNESTEKTNKLLSLFSIGIKGTTTGLVNATLFHPFDRWAYLNQTTKDFPFTWKNLKTNAFHTWTQTITHRTITGGVFFGSLNACTTYLSPHIFSLLNENQPNNPKQFNKIIANFCGGVTAGNLTAVFATPLYAIKTHTLTKLAQSKQKLRFIPACQDMWKTQGVKAFARGLGPVLMRDTVSGGTYRALGILLQETIISKHDQQSHLTVLNDNVLKMSCNFISAGTGTILSSPFNYARNKQCAAENPAQESTATLLKKVWDDSKPFTKINRLRFFKSTFQLNYGIARVAVGMAVGQGLYDAADTIEKYLTNKK